MEQLKFDEFVNEGLFKNIIGMAGRSIKDWAMEPLTDMMKDISKSGDSKKIIKSLKTYIQNTGKALKDKMTGAKSIENLQELVSDELYGVYSALKGVQATQKVSNTYFEEIFKNADKNLVKIMSEKDIKTADKKIKGYVEGLLSPKGGLYKLAGIRESTFYSFKDFLFEDDNKDLDNTLEQQKKQLEQGDKNKTDKGEEDPNKKEEDTKEDSNKEEDTKEDPNLVKLKDVSYKWLSNILSPILKYTPPDESGESSVDGYIELGDKKDHKIDRKVAQGIIKKAGFKKFKKFRNSIGGDKEQFPL